MKKIRVALFISCLGFSQLAFANPSISATQAGSTILFNVSNPDPRDYSCSLTWTISWSEYGTPKSSTLTRSAVVHANQNGLLMKDETTYTGLSFSDFSYKCS
jgi:hypothetical protein